MLYAWDKNNTKIRPQKGESAICPYCLEKVVAVCGQINIHHWRHDKLANCDPWKEHETEWHREWKKNFSAKWRENIIVRNGEKHIADIFTDLGLVLELQNSSISTGTILIREDFYNKMIWLINAEQFKDNFVIRSEVTSRLRNLKHQYEYQYNDVAKFEDRLDERREDLKKVDRKIKNLQRKLNWEQDKLDDFNDFKKVFAENFEAYINSGFYSKVIWDFESSITTDLKEFNSEIEEVEKEIIVQNKKLTLINSFPAVTINGYEAFRQVDFNQIASTFYKICKVVKKDSVNSFFPEVLNINSEIEFSRFAYDRDKYILIADLTENTQYINQVISDLELKKQSLEEKHGTSLQELEIEIQKWLDIAINDQAEKVEGINEKISEKFELQRECLNDLKNDQKMLEQEAEILQKSLKEEKRKREIEIKSTHRGMYSYHWKYRRKTWDFAEKPVFLDFGSHIFHIISDEKLQKLSISEFIEKVKKWS